MLRLAGVIVLLCMPLAAMADPSLKICFRADAAPFSYRDDDGTPNGYTVELCNHVAVSLNLRPEMVEVTSENRFAALQDERCDMLCEATSVTIERRQSVEFSLITFLTGSAFLYPKSLQTEKSPKHTVVVGYLRGTTIENHRRAGTLTGGDKTEFKFEAFGSHKEAEAALLSGMLDGYVADREILERILQANKQLRVTHRVSHDSITYEPYAIAVRMGDDGRRNAIDRILAELFRSRKIEAVLAKHIPSRRRDELLEHLFAIQSLPK